MAHKITTIALWKNLAVGSGSAGGTSLSDPIDLREISRTGNYSVSYNIGTSGAATCGSSRILYLGCPVFDGTYRSPTNGTFGTLGNTGGIDWITMTPPVMPFIKIMVIVGTSGTALINNMEFHVQ